MKKIALIIVFFLTALSGYAAGYNEWWQKANDCYQRKIYDSAAFYYEKIASLKPANSDIYFNLGNAYYRLNQVGPAVLNYQRSLFINPENKKAAENLLLTQNRISNSLPSVPDIFFVAWWKTLTSGTKAGMWAVLSLLFFVIIILLLLGKRTGKGPNVNPQLVGFMIAFWIALIVLAFNSANNLIDSKHAVVMQNDAPLMNNDLKGRPLNLVPEGTTVEELSQKNGWTEVRLPDARVGWMQSSLLTKI